MLNRFTLSLLALPLAFGCASADPVATDAPPPANAARAHQVLERVSAVPGRLGAPVIRASEVARFDRAGAELRAVFAPAAAVVPRRASVVLPALASGSLRVRDERSDVAVSVELVGAFDRVAEIVDGHVVYPAAYPGADVVQRVAPEGSEDFVHFAVQPARTELAYRISLGASVAGLRLFGDALELLDAEGTPGLRMNTPYVAAADGSEHPAHVALEGCAYDSDPRGPWGRAVTSPGARQCTVRVSWADRGVTYPVLVDPAWTATGSLNTARYSHSAARLANGRVLVVAGWDGLLVHTSAELYDPATGAWSPTGPITNKRHSASAVLLANGKVLLAGGGTGPLALTTASELYDPAAGTWTATGVLGSAAMGGTCFTLPNGKIFYAGGDAGISGNISTSLYDVPSGQWVASGSMGTARSGGSYVQLADGRVLASGGSSFAINQNAEVYSPTTGTWSATGNLGSARSGHSSERLANGKVLVAGGTDGATLLLPAEVWDPVAGTWSAAGSITGGRGGAAIERLDDGRVLFFGGSASGTALATALTYDATSGWAAAPALPSGRERFTTTKLADGRLLVAGGLNGGALKISHLFMGVRGTGCSVAADCDSGFCADGVCCNTACGADCSACDVAGSVGTCSPISGEPHGGRDCGAYLCDAGACRTSCSSAAECVAGHYCGGGQCQPLKALGASCAADNECTSAHCIDAVCCDSACAGLCTACAAAMKASGGDGTCGPAADGTDPRGSCAPPTCTGDALTEHLCNGAGACRDQASSCVPFQCNAAGDACDATCTTDNDCGGTSFYCNDQGRCAAKKPRGEACSGSGECAQGTCADGVCCDSACTGACQACAEPGHEGTCVAVTGEPRPQHPACTAFGTTCGGYCDGSKLFDCTFPGATTSCNGGCSNAAISLCDGAGTCAAAAPCAGNFACLDATTCKATCVADGDCAGGYTCKSGGCTAAGVAACSADGTQSIPTATGTPVDCAPYRCNPSSGQCFDDCTSTDRCATGAVCDTGGGVARCVVKKPGAASAEDSGGCAITRRRGDFGLAGVLLAALLAWRRRRDA